MTKKVVVVVLIVVIALAILQFSLNPPSIESLTGAGIPGWIVTAGVVILAAVTGYWAWMNARRQGH